jgi:hypothetical protein
MRRTVLLLVSPVVDKDAVELDHADAEPVLPGVV